MSFDADFPERNKANADGSLKRWERIEQRVGQFVSRHEGWTAEKIGLDRAHEDLRGTRDVGAVQAAGLPDFAVMVGGRLQAVIEVKSSAMDGYAGWTIPESQWLEFPKVQSDLWDDALERFGVDRPEDLPCFIEDAAAPFYLAVVHTDDESKVCFIPWERVRQVARRTCIIEKSGTVTRKYLLQAWEVLHLPWYSMAEGTEGEQVPAPQGVHDAARRSVEPYVFVNGSDHFWSCSEPREHYLPRWTADDELPPTFEQLERIARGLGMVGMFAGKRILDHRGDPSAMPFPRTRVVADRILAEQAADERRRRFLGLLK